MTDLPCPFEKAVLSTRCYCENSTRYYIGEREHAGCSSDTACTNCRFLLEALRENSMFVLKIKTTATEDIPHAKQMRIQIGGLLGLQELITGHSAGDEKVGNIHQLVVQAMERYGSLNDLPFNEIVKSVSAYQARRKRQPLD